MAGVVQRLERRFVVPNTGVRLSSLAPRQSQIRIWLFLLIRIQLSVILVLNVFRSNLFTL